MCKGPKRIESKHVYAYHFIMQSRNLIPLWGITVMKLKQQSDPLTDQMISNI